MPKEKIWDSVQLWDVEVGWNTEAEYVQLGVCSHDGVPLVEHLTDATADGGDPAGFASLWATLDRRQINRLIWALRRARDAAYGRDE